MSVNGYRGYKHFVITSPLTGVLQVQIDSPQKLNVLHEPLWHELNAIFSQSYHDPDIRVVLLSGGGDKVLLASKNPVAMGGSKESNHVRGHIISDRRLDTGRWNVASIQTNDIQQALFYSLDERKPAFEKL